MTVVVPSPTSSSCVLLNSIMLFAAGCATSISRRMAWPSFVRTIPPMGSSNILSIAFGPKQDRMISATLHNKSALPNNIVEEQTVRLCSCNIRNLSFAPNLSLPILRVNDHHRCLHSEYGGRLGASILLRNRSLWRMKVEAVEDPILGVLVTKRLTVVESSVLEHYYGDRIAFRPSWSSSPAKYLKSRSANFLLRHTFPL
jgi:hypothetical protein